MSLYFYFCFSESTVIIHEVMRGGVSVKWWLSVCTNQCLCFWIQQGGFLRLVLSFLLILYTLYTGPRGWRSMYKHCLPASIIWNSVYEHPPGCCIYSLMVCIEARQAVVIQDRFCQQDALFVNCFESEELLLKSRCLSLIHWAQPLFLEKSNFRRLSTLSWFLPRLFVKACLYPLNLLVYIH